MPDKAPALTVPDELIGLLRLAAGDDYLWAAAVVQRESGWNPYAVGDGGRALGLFQMHLDFMAWQFHEYGSKGEVLVLMHGAPFAQAVAFARFWRAYHHEPVQRRLEIYHYGLLSTQERERKGEATDPDGTVKEYFDYYSRFAGKPAPAMTTSAKASATKP